MTELLKKLMMTQSGKEVAQERHQIIVDILYHIFDEFSTTIKARWFHIGTIVLLS